MTEYTWQPEWEILEKEEETMPTFEHGVICTNIILQIGNFIAHKNLGRVLDSSVEYRFLEKSTTKRTQKPRFPDVTFIQQERLPQNMRSYPEIAPDLVVEVVSPTDRDYELEAKVKEYQKVGVKQVWVVHPFSRKIDLYHLATGLKNQTYFNEEELDATEVIVGFKLKLSDIFDYPQPPDEDQSTTSLRPVYDQSTTSL
ncbi:MAG: Uma2 family endonuclease, partial [Chloroflexi bacterium]|nr:Uma2 family endonuclease [Chloroflexota bacterium]